MAADIDLHDTTSTTAGGVHIATLGGIWQAVVLGFCGLRPQRRRAPKSTRACPASGMPSTRGSGSAAPRVRVRVEPGTFTVSADRPVPVVAGRSSATAGPEGVRFERDDDTWRISAPGDVRLRARPTEEDV